MTSFAELALPAGKSLASAFGSLSKNLRLKVESRKISNLGQELERRFFASLDTRGSLDLPEEDAELLGFFLSSREFSEICYQAILIQTCSIATDLRQVVERQLEAHLLAILPQSATTPIASYLADALLVAVDFLGDDPRMSGAFGSDRLRLEAAQRTATTLLASIDRHVLSIAHGRSHHTVKDLEHFEQRYLAALQGRYKKLLPPHFGNPRHVPFNSIYVRPSLRTSAEASVEFADFISTLQRTVVLGDPGAGKSTLSIRVLLDAISKKGLAGRPFVPFLVVLRDYASKRSSEGRTILDFISRSVKTISQVDQVTTSTIDYYLSTGRSLVIFDGLDELLDTTARREVVAEVEQFARLYPSIPVLVTSRRVGYSEAPLDSDDFSVTEIDSFSSPQIEEYVKKWFKVCPDLRSEERPELAKSFLLESSQVPDLISNPLMLALMCNLYRGDRYIPKNRPDLYEKCSNWLFERWDKERGILVELPFKEHIRPAMMALAAGVYGDEHLQNGIPESLLRQLTANYLLENKYDDVDKAQAAAETFVEFCTGRAWVFSNVGADSQSELFMFTHRTFLEYFAAAHYVRMLPNSDRLLEALKAHILVAEWDVLAQLAVQMLSKQVLGAADEIVRELLRWSEQERHDQSANAILFACRCLQFLEPHESVVRELTRAALALVVDQVEEVYPQSKTASSVELPYISCHDLLMELRNASIENSDAIFQAVDSCLGDNPLELAVVRHLMADGVPYAGSRIPVDLHSYVRSKCPANWELHPAVQSDFYIQREMHGTDRRRRHVRFVVPLSERDRSDAADVRNIFVPALDAYRLSWQAPPAYDFLIRMAEKASRESCHEFASIALQNLEALDRPWFRYHGTVQGMTSAISLDMRSASGLSAISNEVAMLAVVLSMAAIEAIEAIREVEAISNPSRVPPDGKLGAWDGPVIRNRNFDYDRPPLSREEVLPSHSRFRGPDPSTIARYPTIYSVIGGWWNECAVVARANRQRRISDSFPPQ